MATKICSKCGIEKDIDLFVVVSRYPDGHGACCKECHNNYNRKSYYDNIDERREKGKINSRKYNKVHPERHRASFKKYRLNNPERRKQTEKEYRAKNLDKIRKWKRDDYLRHRDKRANTNKLYIERNRIEINKKNKERRNSTPQNKLKHNLRNRIRVVLNGTQKGGHLPELVGCSVDFLKQHLESQFKNGMSWSNYGSNGWVVDHYIPLDAFDLTDMTQQLAAFNWRNLNPLWLPDNSKKKNKYNQDDFDAYMELFLSILNESTSASN